jgi:hypothetical protein
VLDRYGSVAYKLDLPSSSDIHPVFHVSHLKTYVPDHTLVFTDLPTQLQLDVASLEPEKILDRRLVKRANASYLQVLIKWSNMPETMATWEDDVVLRQRLPEAAAWGQAGSQGGASVTPGVPQDMMSSGKAPGGNTPSRDEDNE